MGPSLPEFFPYRRPPELDGEGRPHRQVIIAGAGPVGLAMALEWAQRGHDVLVLAASDTLSEGSRAICFAKRTLEICDRLGYGDPVVNKGVSWNLGKVFRHDGLLYEFNLLPESGHERPAFVNLQQYYFEHYQLQALSGHAISPAGRDPAAAATPYFRPPSRSSPAGWGGAAGAALFNRLEEGKGAPLAPDVAPGARAAQVPHAASSERGVVELRWNNRVTAVTQTGDTVTLAVECPEGSYGLSCDWLIACDGAGSPIRKMLGLKSEGQVFQDRFLIVDVKMEGASIASFRNERWFWFDPPFHRNRSALLHKQADDVWRIDFQLGWDADSEEEKKPENVVPRIQAMLGADVQFSLVWASVYTFQCRRMARFVHGRVIFAGDSAHQVSPFGARGANSGIQDVDNLGWKLDLILRGAAPAELLESYNSERSQAADENIANSTRSTDFITPKSEMSRIFRDATLDLAAKYPFARKLVNSGRLSVPAQHRDSPLNTRDADVWPDEASLMVAPGSPGVDAPVFNEGRPAWLLRYLGLSFTVVVFVHDSKVPGALLDELERMATAQNPLRVIVVTRRPVAGRGAVIWLVDTEALSFSRYAPGGKAVYLFRPDQHVAGRRAILVTDWIGAAVRRACMTDVPPVLKAG